MSSMPRAASPGGLRTTAKMLTTAAVAKLKPASQRIEISDAGAPGLRLVIHPTGRKTWITRFRRPNGKAGNLTLGPLDTSGNEEHEPIIGQPLTVTGARILANEVSRQRAREVDVVALRSAEKQRKRIAITGRGATTFAGLAQDFISERVTRKTGKKPRRWIEDARLLGMDFSKTEASGVGEPPAIVRGGLADRWRDKAVAEIDGDDIYAVIEESRRHGVPGMRQKNSNPSDARGRHMAAALSAMFKWLHAHRRIKLNPCVGVHKPPPSPARDRVLSDAEVKKFWAACTALGDPFGSMLKLLLLTGCRLNEIARLENDELKDDGSMISLPGRRTKNALPHDIPLPPLAQTILASVQRIPNCKFVFSTSGEAPVSGFSKAKIRIEKLLSIPPWSFHDLRRTAVTGMNELGVPPHIAEVCVNHISGAAKGGIAETYNKARYEPEKRAAFKMWADHVAEIVQ